MRLLALLVGVVACTALGWGFGRGGGLTCPPGFRGGGLTPCQAITYPAFEFAPADGGGMPSVCDSDGTHLNPQGSRGEVLTFTRAGTATCLSSTSLVSGIEPGQMYTVNSNVARVMYGDSSGVKGFLQEKTRTNNCIRNTAFDNAAWTSTATVTADAFADPLGTTTADQLDDGSAVASLGSCQVITTTSATKHVVSVFVRAGTATSAAITMTGVGSSTGDCSATATALVAGSYNRITCASAADYEATLIGVTVCINVGNDVAVTGTIGAWGFQHETSSLYPSSVILTAAAAVARAADSSLLLSTLPAGTPFAGSSAATFIPGWANGQVSPAPYLLYFNAGGRLLFSPIGTSFCIYDAVTEICKATTFVLNTSGRYSSNWAGSTMSVTNSTGTASAAYDGTMGIGAASMDIGGFVATAEIDGVIKMVCLDPDPTRCQ